MLDTKGWTKNAALQPTDHARKTPLTETDLVVTDQSRYYKQRQIPIRV